MTRRSLIAGNWKMFKNTAETIEFFDLLLPKIEDIDYCDVVVAPPYTALSLAAERTRNSQVGIAGQDVYWEDQGAFTGSVSASMLRDVGCSYVIIGHSERRQYFRETDEMVAKKISPAIKAGLKPIICVGETLDEREGGCAEEIVKRQITEGLARLTEEELYHIIIAYEPVWAIGTGRTATPDIAEDMHAKIRSSIVEIAGTDIADGTRILYGGSVKSSNIKDLMDKVNIDGALVGGASLKADSFVAVIRYMAN